MENTFARLLRRGARTNDDCTLTLSSPQRRCQNNGKKSLDFSAEAMQASSFPTGAQSWKSHSLIFPPKGVTSIFEGAQLEGEMHSLAQRGDVVDTDSDDDDNGQSGNVDNDDGKTSPAKL